MLCARLPSVGGTAHSRGALINAAGGPRPGCPCASGGPGMGARGLRSAHGVGGARVHGCVLPRRDLAFAAQALVGEEARAFVAAFTRPGPALLYGD